MKLVEELSELFCRKALLVVELLERVSQGLTQDAGFLRTGSVQSVRRSTRKSETGCTECPSGSNSRNQDNFAIHGGTWQRKMSAKNKIKNININKFKNQN